MVLFVSIKQLREKDSDQNRLRDEAWQYFDRTYNLEDNREIELWVKEILRGQPVYKYIYKQ